MKNINKIYYLLLCCAFLISCSEEDIHEKVKGSGIAPSPIIEASATGDYGEVVLKWINPDDTNFDYTNIVYTNSNGEKISKNISKYAYDPVSGYSIDTIQGFADTQEYSFSLTACNITGAAAAPKTITVAPLTPAYEFVNPTITAEADFGGIKVEWKNTTGKPAKVVVSYLLNGRKEQRSFNANKSGSGSLSGLPVEEFEFTIGATDAYGNQSETKTFVLTPYSEIEIPKSLMSIPGYVESSTEETIGYSSQASNEDNNPGAIKGRAIAIIDRDISKDSFWSSSWAPQKQYPHWIIIDLGKEYVISRVELMRRINDKRMQKGHQFLTCTEAEATDMTNSEVWAWEDQGTFDFNPNTDDVQSYRLSKNPKARYLKIYFPLDKKGTTNDAMLGEAWIYGAE